MKIRLAAPIQTDSIVDGEGIRTVIWTQGCLHNCKGCHNPETHAFDKGFLIDIEDVKKELSQIAYQDGITLSGGDPLYQIEPVLEIAKYAKKNNLNVWCYTGFLFEELIEKSELNPSLYNLLENIDVLVDGKFVEEKKSMNLPFRGSSNQRIIDVPKSLKENKAVLIEKFREKKGYTMYSNLQNVLNGVFI